MSVIKMYGYEAAQQTEYQTKKWATKEGDVGAVVWR